MFSNDLIDLFSRTRPGVVPALYIPGALLPIGYGVLVLHISVQVTLALAAMGYITWTLTEYWLHRLVFHFKPRGALGEKVHFLIHGVHHQWPKDKYRLVMPPAVSLSLYWVFAALFLLVLGPSKWLPFHGGFVTGYMVYDMTHYAIHHLRPRTEFGRRLKKHHMQHHFKNPKSHFGVSTMVWDRVFGTR